MVDQYIGQYRVVRLLGEGGMGMVYEAVREDIGVRAAVKVLRDEYARSPEVAMRFFNEARAANLVQHPGIVRIFDYGNLPSGGAYLAMELLDGESLRGRLLREVRISEVDTIRLGRQIAAALASAHKTQLVHRDLKPENVMLVPDAETPGGDRAKILDFGIAKLAASSHNSVRTQTNAMMGTPMYMSPEQCRGLKTVGDRADVYALGVMLFEMLAGRPPFVSDSPGELIAKHLMEAPPLLNGFLPDVDQKLNALVASMLGKDAESRPAMADVARTLKELGNLTSDWIQLPVPEPAPGTGGRNRSGAMPQVVRKVPSPVPAQTPPGARAAPREAGVAAHPRPPTGGFAPVQQGARAVAPVRPAYTPSAPLQPPGYGGHLVGLASASEDLTRVMGSRPSPPAADDDATRLALPSAPESNFVVLPRSKASAEALRLTARPTAAPALSGRGVLIVALLIVVVAVIGFLVLSSTGT